MLAADNIKINYKELRKRYPLSEIAYERASSNPDKFGLISTETLATVIEAFADGLEPLPNDYAPPVPPVDDAVSSVETMSQKSPRYRCETPLS